MSAHGPALLAVLRALDPDERREVAELLFGPYLADAEPEWLTVDEAAAYARVSPSTIRAAARSGRLVVAQAGPNCKLAIRRSDVDKWRAA